MLSEHCWHDSGQNIPEHTAAHTGEHSQKNHKCMILSITAVDGRIGSGHGKQSQTDGICEIQDPLKPFSVKFFIRSLIEPCHHRTHCQRSKNRQRQHHPTGKHGRRHDSQCHIPDKTASGCRYDSQKHDAEQIHFPFNSKHGSRDGKRDSSHYFCNYLYIHCTPRNLIKYRENGDICQAGRALYCTCFGLAGVVPLV